MNTIIEAFEAYAFISNNPVLPSVGAAPVDSTAVFTLASLVLSNFCSAFGRSVML